MALSDSKVKGLKTPGRYGDGDGLYMNVAKGGSRSWVQRVVFEGRRRDIGLGSYPGITLRTARKLALDNRDRIGRSLEPLSARERQNGRRPAVRKATFREAAEDFHAENAGALWTNEKNIAIWIQRAESYLFPIIGDTPVDKVTAAQLLDILIPLQVTRPETAKRVRQIARQTLKRALARGLITSNPAVDMAGGLPPSNSTPAHFRMVAHPDVSAALRDLDESTANLGVKLALRFLVLTAARPGEVRHMRWDDVDGDTWTVPADRQKSRKEHRVPLSTAALDVLAQAKALDRAALVFPGINNTAQPLSENTLGRALRGAGIEATAHGFRSSFRTWAAEMATASWAAVELSLGHAVGNSVEQAYFRTDLLDQRRPLMEAWGAYITE